MIKVTEEDKRNYEDNVAAIIQECEKENPIKRYQS